MATAHRLSLPEAAIHQRNSPVEVPAAADTWPHTAPLRTGDQRRARVHPEPPPRGHYELGVEEGANLRVLTAFDELTLPI
jgi:hypothetical protein